MARAILLLIAAMVAVALVLALEPGQPPGAGTFPVEIAGPQAILFSGNVTLEDATAYTVLLAAAAEAGLDVEATGSGENLFVTSIGGHGNHGSGGWCYAVWEGHWVQPAHSAAVAGLADGQAVRWSYERQGCGALG